MGRCSLPPDTKMTKREWDAYYALHPDEVPTLDESDAECYGITLELLPQFRKLSNQKFSEWPEGMYAWVRDWVNSRPGGACGEVILSGIGAYLMSHR
jgi:hypothetical protein